ncbi:hypothetical protein [Streptomyces asiaticus]|uniref:hypothetical protein n=1 Tax=Streptomyces asiaticus TaxID=114695 RepID=UPI003D75A0D2
MRQRRIPSHFLGGYERMLAEIATSPLSATPLELPGPPEGAVNPPMRSTTAHALFL